MKKHWPHPGPPDKFGLEPPLAIPVPVPSRPLNGSPQGGKNATPPGEGAPLQKHRGGKCIAKTA